MPIYAYKCESCGHRQDVLQKVSDPALHTCPACGAARFVKQLTAAGFQLKGSGWYVTDFRGGNKAAPADKAETGDATGDSVKAEKAGKDDKGAKGESADKAGNGAAKTTEAPRAAPAAAGAPAADKPGVPPKPGGA